MMPQVKYRAFRIGYGDIAIESCQDALAISPDLRRFAVSDGVSASYRPDVLARLLVESFAEGAFEGSFDRWLAGDGGKIVADRWRDVTDAEEEAAEGRYKWLLKNSRTQFGSAAATFAGLIFDSAGELSYEVLGDSAIFFFPADGEPTIVASVERDAEPAHPLKSAFNNLPANIDSFGNASGEFIKGRVDMVDGVVVLATDAVAEWLAKTYDPATGDGLSEIMELETDDDFDAFVQRHRPIDMHNDDSTLIIVELSNAYPTEEQKPDIFEWLKHPFGLGVKALLPPPIYDGPKPPPIPFNESASESADTESGLFGSIKKTIKNIFKTPDYDDI